MKDSEYVCSSYIVINTYIIDVDDQSYLKYNHYKFFDLGVARNIPWKKLKMINKVKIIREVRFFFFYKTTLIT